MGQQQREESKHDIQSVSHSLALIISQHSSRKIKWQAEWYFKDLERIEIRAKVNVEYLCRYLNNIPTCSSP